MRASSAKDALRPLLVIAGPTGSGKSSLALRLSEDFSGEIVNCDSLQLYRGFQVGTAKTPEPERRGIPHHLLDVADPRNGYSAGRYAREARIVVREISERGKLPVVVGGTGFYLRALLSGLPALPERDAPLRARLTAKEERKPGALHRLLARLEPASARQIHPNDTQKTLRALEIRLLTRSALPPVDTAEPLVGYRVLKIGLDPERNVLFQHLDERARQMFQNGLIEEVRGLLASGLTGEEKPFESLGYKQALMHIRSMLTLEEAITSTQIETRQYAKRQWTWFRRERDIHWLSGFGHWPSIIEQSRELVLHFH